MEALPGQALVKNAVAVCMRKFSSWLRAREHQKQWTCRCSQWRWLGGAGAGARASEAVWELGRGAQSRTDDRTPRGAQVEPPLEALVGRALERLRIRVFGSKP